MREQTTRSLSGQLLIASPKRRNPTFAKTVILPIRHDDRGAFGLVVNRPSNGRLSTLWDRRVRRRYGRGHQLNLGGPITGPLMALHTSRFLAEVEVLPEVFFSEAEQNLVDLLGRDDARCKVFLGHINWEPRRLEHELKHGFWLTAPAAARHVLSNDEQLWKKLLSEIGSAVLRPLFNVARILQNPLLN